MVRSTAADLYLRSKEVGQSGQSASVLPATALLHGASLGPAREGLNQTALIPAQV